MPLKFLRFEKSAAQAGRRREESHERRAEKESQVINQIIKSFMMVNKNVTGDLSEKMRIGFDKAGLKLLA